MCVCISPPPKKNSIIWNIVWVQIFVALGTTRQVGCKYIKKWVRSNIQCKAVTFSKPLFSLLLRAAFWCLAAHSFAVCRAVSQWAHTTQKCQPSDCDDWHSKGCTGSSRLLMHLSVNLRPSLAQTKLNSFSRVLTMQLGRWHLSPSIALFYYCGSFDSAFHCLFTAHFHVLASPIRPASPTCSRAPLRVHCILWGGCVGISGGLCQIIKFTPFHGDELQNAILTWS